MRFLDKFCKSVMCGLTLAALVPPGSANADSFTVLYAFKGGTDSAAPLSVLLADKAGNFYGTASEGGAHGGGTVYRLAPDGTETVLYSFCSAIGKPRCHDGEFPAAGLVADDAGNLFGTTAGDGYAHGTVFSLAPDGTETVRHYFATGRPANGLVPCDGLVANMNGSLVGTTEYGGNTADCDGVGCGIVFQVEPEGRFKVLYAFTGGTDGQQPFAGLLAYKGNYYGTTYSGGSGGGTVFKLAPDGTKTVLYSFTGGTDGARSWAGLIVDAASNLYGTTSGGGNLAGCGGQGCGTVFKLAPDGTETVLYSFTGGADGSFPFAGLIADAAGNLYGTTSGGGNLADCGGQGCGTVFKLAPDGTETVLHAFTDGSDGAAPTGGLILKNGYLYGTASTGGGSSGSGTIFRLRM